MNPEKELLRTPYLVAMDRSEKAEARIQSLESRISEMESIAKTLVSYLEEIGWHSNVQSSAFSLIVSNLVRKSIQEWNEHNAWKNERSYQFCKHVEKEEENEY